MAYIRVVPEFKTSSTRIKPLFAYALLDVCIGNSGFSLLILTSHNDTCKFEMFWSSLAIFLQNNPLLIFARTTSFRRQTSHKFGRLFS
jgi:hypothetical protein